MREFESVVVRGYREHEGHVSMIVELDGDVAIISDQQKRTLVRVGIVSLGHAWGSRISTELDADPALGQPASTLPGCTRDTEVVRRTRELLDACDNPDQSILKRLLNSKPA